MRHSTMPFAVVVCCAIVLWNPWDILAASPDGAYARIEPKECVIGNAALERKIQLVDAKGHTSSIRNKIADRIIAMESSEFALTIDESHVLTAADFALRNSRVEDLPQGVKRLVLTLVNDRLEVELRHEVARAAPVMRKVLAVRARGDSGPLLNRIEVERFSTAANCELGGLGQPVFIAGHMFCGLEYPGAQNEAKKPPASQGNESCFQVALRHLPGKVVTTAFLESKPAVVGVSPPDGVEQAFAKYLAGIRIPPRTHVHYNSWYDIRRKQMSTEVLLETFAGFKKNLCDKYGVRMDSFVLDDGWQDHQSIWEIDRSLFPAGFAALAEGLKAGGSSLGLWHPLTAVGANLAMPWCREHGYETDKSGSHLCLAAPQHNKQLREVMARHIAQYGLTYFKHDFNSFNCDGEGHGHLPRAAYGFEANVDAYIEMLKFLRQQNPKIFLNCTGGMWLSPWWLMYCDTVWRGASDTGYEKAYPFVDQRAQAISYVDGVLYDNFIRNRYQFPISALMVHGIVYGQLHMLGGREEPLQSWTDNAVWSMCLGLMMKELYITPRLLSDAHWDVLGKTLRWAEANRDVLVEAQMLSGNPHHGEITGYRHAVGDRTIVFLRNPSLHPQKAAIDFLPPQGGREPRLVEVVYPYRKVLCASAHPAQKLEVALAPNEMLAIEATPAAVLSRPLVEGCRYALVGESAREFVFDLIGEAAGEVAVKVRSPARIAEILIDNVAQAVTSGNEVNLSLTLPAPPQPVEVADVSDAAGPLRNTVRITLPPGSAAGRFSLVCDRAASVLPLSPITVNGKLAKPSLLYGDRWKTFQVPLTEGVHTVGWEIQVAARPKVPFAARSFVMSSYAAARRPLGVRHVTVRLADALPPARPALPTPFAAQQADLLPIQAAREINTVAPGGLPTLTAAQMKTIKAARLHLSVFGANPEDRYAAKSVSLNGVSIGMLPANPRSKLDAWVEQVMEIPTEKLAILGAENGIVVANCGGDAFKFGDVGLAVQLPDGTWVESDREGSVYCGCGTRGGWLHHEGIGFSDKSPIVRLTLPVVR